MLATQETMLLMDEKSVPVRVSFETDRGSEALMAADYLDSMYGEDMEVRKEAAEAGRVSFVLRLKAHMTDVALILDRVSEVLDMMHGAHVRNFTMEILPGGGKSERLNL